MSKGNHLFVITENDRDFSLSMRKKVSKIIVRSGDTHLCTERLIEIENYRWDRDSNKHVQREDPRIAITNTTRQPGESELIFHGTLTELIERLRLANLAEEKR